MVDVVRGGRTDLRASPQSLCAGGRAALPSSRHRRARRRDTRRNSQPRFAVQTGLPTRYYIDRTDIAFEHLKQTGTQTLCPYKGVTSGYWSVRVMTRCTLTSPGPTPCRWRPSRPSRTWSRSTTRRSTSPSTVCGSHGRRPTSDSPLYAVGDVGVLRVLVDVLGDHPAGRNDAQSFGSRGPQSLGNENRCQAAALELRRHLGVGNTRRPSPSW